MIGYWRGYRNDAYRPLDLLETRVNGSNLGSFVDVSAVAWCILRKADGRLPKTKGVSVEVDVFWDKTLVNRRMVRSISVGGSTEGKGMIDDGPWTSRNSRIRSSPSLRQYLCDADYITHLL